MAQPKMYGKVFRNKRTASGFHEHHSATKTTTSPAFDKKVYNFTMEAQRLGKGGKSIFGKTTPKKSGIYAAKLPGKGSPKHTTPKVAKHVHGTGKGRATGQQTKSSPKLVGY